MGTGVVSGGMLVVSAVLLWLAFKPKAGAAGTSPPPSAPSGGGGILGIGTTPVAPNTTVAPPVANNNIPLNVGQRTGTSPTAPSGTVTQLGGGTLVDIGGGQLVPAGTIVTTNDGTQLRYGVDSEGNTVMTSAPAGVQFPAVGTIRYDDNGKPNGYFGSDGYWHSM